MTQLGRFAHITKKELKACRIVQDSVFHRADPTSGQPRQTTAAPVDTGVFLTLDEPDEEARKMVVMGERTCFLHAAMRGSHPSQVQIARSNHANGGFK